MKTKKSLYKYLLVGLALAAMPLSGFAQIHKRDEIPDYSPTLPHWVYVERQTIDGDTDAIVGEKMDLQKALHERSFQEFKYKSWLSKWFAALDEKSANNEVVNILVGIDSLTAGSNGFSYVQPFRKLVQETMGDAGIGYQMPTIFWEFGTATLGYTGWTAETLDPDTLDDRMDAMSIETLYTETSSVVANYTVSHSNINREITEVDIFYQKFPAGATSFAAKGYLSGSSSVLSAYSVENDFGVVTTSGYSYDDDLAATIARVDSNNGPMRLLGLNIRREIDQGGARVHFWAKGGSKVQQWASISDDGLQFLITELDVDLAILNAGMNDRLDRTKTEYKADMENLIVNFQAANPDIAILLMMPTIPESNAGNLASYREALLELCTDYGCAYVDTAWIIGDNVSAKANGFLTQEAVHPSEIGTRLIAKYLFEYIGGASLSLKTQTEYGSIAKTRDINARAVRGWYPGLMMSESQAFTGQVSAPFFQIYTPSNESVRNYKLPDFSQSTVATGTPITVYDLGLTNGSVSACLSFTAAMNRHGTGSIKAKRFHVYISNSSGIINQATGTDSGDAQTLYELLAGDSQPVDLTLTVTNNGTTNRCEIAVTPTVGGASFTDSNVYVYDAEIRFLKAGSAGQAVWDN